MLFSHTCNTIVIRNQTDVIEIEDFIKGFTFDSSTHTADHEIVSFYRFVIAALKLQKINLPTTLIKPPLKHKSPDFRLAVPGEEPYLGVEHTQATLPDHERDIAELCKSPEGGWIECSAYKAGHTISKGSKVARKNRDENLTHTGYGDHGIENQWVEIILRHIEKKTNKLNNPKFAKFRQNHLLLEDTGPTPVFIRLDKAITILREKHLTKIFRETLRYDKIHIDFSDFLVYDIFGQHVKVKVE